VKNHLLKHARIYMSFQSFPAVEPFAALALLKPVPFDALLMLLKNLCEIDAEIP